MQEKADGVVNRANRHEKLGAFMGGHGQALDIGQGQMERLMDRLDEFEQLVDFASSLAV